MEHKDLAAGLDGWFERVSRVPDWVRVKSPVWRVMRQRLTVLGHWKNRPRGNPKRGYLVSRERINRE